LNRNLRCDMKLLRGVVPILDMESSVLSDEPRDLNKELT